MEHQNIEGKILRLGEFREIPCYVIRPWNSGCNGWHNDRQLFNRVIPRKAGLGIIRADQGYKMVTFSFSASWGRAKRCYFYISSVGEDIDPTEEVKEALSKASL